MVAVGVYLRSLRNAAGPSQEQAAKQIGIAAKTIERWEAGSHEPALTTLRPYLAALHGSVLRVIALLFSTAPEDEVRRLADLDRRNADHEATETDITAQFLSLTGERRQTAILVLEQLLAAEAAGTAPPDGCARDLGPNKIERTERDEWPNRPCDEARIWVAKNTDVAERGGPAEGNAIDWWHRTASLVQ